MKKIKLTLFAVVFICTLLTACEAQPQDEKGTADDPPTETETTVTQDPVDVTNENMDVKDEAADGETDELAGEGIEAPQASNMSDTDIPVELRGYDWGDSGLENSPVIVLHEDGSYELWSDANGSYDMKGSTYKVYLYNEYGPRTIEFDTAGLNLDHDFLRSKFYLTESEGGVWSFNGVGEGSEAFDMGYNKTDMRTITVPAERVMTPGFDVYGRIWEDEKGNRLTIGWIDGGFVYYDLDINGSLSST